MSPVVVRQAGPSDLEAIVPLFDGYRQLYPSFSSVSMAPIFILNDLFVQPEARRSGVARLLLDAAVSHGREAGAIRLSLSTARTNTAAQELYASAGWERDEVFSVYHYALPRPRSPAPFRSEYGDPLRF